MGHLILANDNFIWPGFALLDENSLAITMFDPGPHFQELSFLILGGTTSVSIASGATMGGDNVVDQLAENNNVLTRVTITGAGFFRLGSIDAGTAKSNSGDGVVTDIAATAASPTTIYSSLTLINASATTGALEIFAGATNTSGAGQFANGQSLNPNVTITYKGLTIKGGSGSDFIENDAKNGIVAEGNANGDGVVLGGAGAKATLGTGAGDQVYVGISHLATNEAAGSALGDKVTFGNAATAHLVVGTGAEAGSTAGTTSIGLTKVVNAEAGMTIDFSAITNSSIIVDLTNAVAGMANLTAAENTAVAAMGGLGVAFFNFRGNEYFIATNSIDPPAVGSNDAIVKLVGVHDLGASNSSGLVTLHA